MSRSIRRSIRTKIMVLVSIAMVGLLTLLFIISTDVYSASFNELERTESLEWVGIMENSVQNELRSIHAPANDYANWNDTYSFMIDHNQTYVDANLIPETFRNLEMSYIVLVSTNGEIAFGKEYNATSDSLDPLSPGMTSHLAADGMIVSGCASGNETVGLLMVDGRPVLCVARPILTSEAQGPSEGALLMGRMVGETLLGRFADSIGMPLAMFEMNDPVLRAEIGEAAWNELITNYRTIHALNESIMGGYTLAMDVYGDPGMVLRVSVLRDVHAQGVVSLNNLAILLAIVSVGFGVVVFLLIERTVVSRLSGLRQEVSRLDPNSAGEMRVGFHGEDEIGGLGDSINEMLATIDTAQKDLIASEKRYRLLVNSAAEAIVVIQDGTIRLVNPMTVSMIGLAEAELLSKPFPETIHPEDRAFVVDNHKKRLRGEAVPNRYHFRLLTKDGGFKWVEISAVAIDWEGRPATLNFLTDVTERKRAEDALRLANTKLGIMTTVARHDIGNQMMVVNGFIELSKLRVNDPDLTKYLDKMSQATANVQEQIAFTKDYQELGIRAPAWAAVGEGIVESFNSLSPIGLTVEDRTQGLEIMADPLVGRVFYNLVENSIRHGDGVKRIRVSAEPRGDAMLVVYEDDGVGIKDEDRAHIFEKGFGRNSGYGLFLIREILAITGITIEEKGKAGKGVRFEMTVPPGAWRMKQH